MPNTFTDKNNPIHNSTLQSMKCSVMPHTLQPLGVNRGTWSTCHFSYFTPKITAPGIHYTGSLNGTQSPSSNQQNPDPAGNSSLTIQPCMLLYRDIIQNRKKESYNLLYQTPLQLLLLKNNSMYKFNSGAG
jgi:hypothetical protein